MFDNNQRLSMKFAGTFLINFLNKLKGNTIARCVKSEGLVKECTRVTISRIYCYIHTLITKNKHYSNNIVINVILYAIIESFINRSENTENLASSLIGKNNAYGLSPFINNINSHNGIRSTAPAYCCVLRKKRKLLDVILSATQYLISRRKCAISRARSTREPIDCYRTIINMTVRYLKNLSFNATCTFKYKCT